MESYNEIEEFGEASEEWLRKYFELPNGIPSHDTFNRVFSEIDPKQFQDSSNQKAIHMVSAWANENRRQI